MIEVVLACLTRDWSPEIGDPHIAGWLTVVLYVVTAVLAAAVLFRGPPMNRAVRLFWWIVALAMAFLAVNKQLDLQSALTAAGRCLSLAQGWYAERRLVQMVFIVVLVVATVAVLVMLVEALRHDLARNFLAMIGLVLVGGFVLLRAVGFHAFDALIRTTLQGLRINWVLEWTGPLLICTNAAALLIIAGRQPRLND